MNQTKLKDYNLRASIHTLSIRCNGLLKDADNRIMNCIKANSRKKDDIITTTVIINPNKLEGDIFTFSEFKAAFKTILEELGIEEYHVVRADMSLDSYDANHYQKYAKLNQYLIALLAVTYQSDNSYRAIDLFSQRQLSTSLKNRYFEIEHYDKYAESHGKSLAKSRLEVRSKRWQDKDFKQEFTDGWFLRWDKAIKSIELLHQRFNDDLEQLYLSSKNTYPVQFRNFTEFIIKYQHCIYCESQMIDLLLRLDEINPDKAKNRAVNYKKRYRFEYFSEKNVKYAIQEIKRATLEFFNN